MEISSRLETRWKLAEALRLLAAPAHIPLAKVQHMVQPTVWTHVLHMGMRFPGGVLMHPQNWYKGAVGHYEGSVCRSTPVGV